MPFYRQVGDIPSKRHTRFRKPDGSLHTEELMGEEGFSFDSSLLYHLNPPTAIIAIEPVDTEEQRVEPNHPLKPRHFKTHGLKGGGDLVSGRHLLLANDDCRISYVSASQTSPLTKNAAGDELVFIEEGAGVLEEGPHVFVLERNQLVEARVEPGVQRRVAEAERQQQEEQAERLAPLDQHAGENGDEGVGAGDVGCVHQAAPWVLGWASVRGAPAPAGVKI